MVGSTPLNVLTAARRRDVPWPRIVAALRALENEGALDEHGRSWVQVASELSGYSTHQLRQALRTIAAIEELIDDPKARDATLYWPLSSLEILTRIAKADRDKAKELLGRSSRTSFRDLRRIYDHMRSIAESRATPMSAGQRAAHEFRRTLAHTLSAPSTLRHILEVDDARASLRFMTWPGGFWYAHPDHVAVLTGTRERLHAFEGLRVFGDANQDVAARGILHAAIEASFFARYYLCLPKKSSPSTLLNMRRELGLSNLGILIVGPDHLEIVIQPTGFPSPDRQTMILENGYMRERLGLMGTKSVRHPDPSLWPPDA